MPKARHRKETSFQNTVTRSVFLYGKPNVGKRSVLEHMVSAFSELVNRDIRILDSTPGIFLQLVKNDKKDPEMRKLEKPLRIPGYNSAFCQNAFDQAVTHLSNRLDSIRMEMIPMFGIFARSKVLFAMSVSGSSRRQMASALASIGQKFHKYPGDTGTDRQGVFLPHEGIQGPVRHAVPGIPGTAVKECFRPTGFQAHEDRDFYQYVLPLCHKHHGSVHQKEKDRSPSGHQPSFPA